MVHQLQQSLRSSGLLPEAQLEVSLIALAWAGLSWKQVLPPELRLTRALVSDPDSLADTYMKLAEVEEAYREAFRVGAAAYLRRHDVRNAFDLALQVAEAGVLDRFDAADAVNSLPSNSSGAAALPPEIAELLVDLATLSPGETAYTPWDFGAQLATRVDAEQAKAFLESPLDTPIPALVRLLSGAAFSIRIGDPIRQPSYMADGRPKQFDVAVAFPPMGQRYSADVLDRDWFHRFPERTNSGTVLALRHLLSQTKRRIVVAVPNNFTFGLGAERQLRQELVGRGMLRSVMAMSAGLLASSGLAFTILVIDVEGGLEEVQFISANDEKFAAPVSRARSTLVNRHVLVELCREIASSDHSTVVPTEEVLRRGSELQASNYLLPGNELELHPTLAKLPRAALGELVSTVRPPQTLKTGEGIEVGEIGAADIPSHGFIRGPGRRVIVENSGKNEQNFLRPFDIVLILKGSVGKVGIVPNDVPPPGPDGWVAGQSAIILRVVSPSIDPRALALQLRSDFGQQLLRQLVKGATIPLIQVRELLSLEVLVSDMELSDRACAALEREAALQQQIEAIKGELEHVAADVWQGA